MTAQATTIDIRHIIAPRSIAIIGATEDTTKFGGRISDNVVRHGFGGVVNFINPRRTSIFGLPAYPDIATAPGPVDVALLAVPATGLLDAVKACVAAGVGACVVVTAQLAEFDAAGARLQNEIVAVARAGGMRLIGPNCMGMISPASALGLTSSPTVQHVDRLRAGPVGLVSQSGALMGALFMFGHDHGVGFSAMITVGNQADLTLCDFYEGLVDDPTTSTICLYAEDVGDGARFRAIGARARRLGKRTIVLKAGQSEAGAEIARSHTASLAGSYSAFQAACRDTGILVADEAEGMIMAAGVMAANPRMRHGGIGMVVSSGGNGAVTVDRMANRKIPIAAWTEATRSRMSRHFLPAHQNNPIDLGAHKGALEPVIFTATIEAAFEDSNVAALVYLMTPQPLMPQTMQALIDVWRRQEKPVIVVLDTSRFADNIRQMALDAGMPFLSRIDDALRVIDLMIAERGFDAAIADLPARPGGPVALPATLASGYLTEPAAKALFAGYGIPVTREALAHDAAGAVAAAERLGFPVVLKGVSDTIIHKSDSGLVKLRLADGDAVRQAFADVAAVLGVAPVVSVQEMVEGKAEMIVGARRDPTFGAQILVGFGGTLVEVIADIQIACAPVSPDGAEAMLRRLTLWPLLDGVRGGARLDVAALVDLIVRMSWLAHDLGYKLVDLEINPVLVRAGDGGVCAVDGRGTIA
jgi:acetyl-CoA synthetase (ADP-forming)